MLVAADVIIELTDVDMYDVMMMMMMMMYSFLRALLCWYDVSDMHLMYYITIATAAMFINSIFSRLSRLEIDAIAVMILVCIIFLIGRKTSL